MITFIVPEDGSLESQDMQYLKVKRGDNIQFQMNFYKDKFKVYPWNLTSPAILNFFAKTDKLSTTYRINKDKASLDWDLTDAVDGIIKLILNNTNEGASITGDRDNFVGLAGDTLKVTVDSIIFDDIAIAAGDTINNVVFKINAAVGQPVASNSGGYLKLTSTQINGNANITIEDGTGATQPVVYRLFSSMTSFFNSSFGRDVASIGVGGTLVIEPLTVNDIATGVNAWFKDDLASVDGSNNLIVAPMSQTAVVNFINAWLLNVAGGSPVVAPVDLDAIADTLDLVIGRDTASVVGGELVLDAWSNNDIATFLQAFITLWDPSATVVVDGGGNIVITISVTGLTEPDKTASGRYGDLNVSGSYYCEVQFAPNGSSRNLKTIDMILDVQEDVYHE